MPGVYARHARRIAVLTATSALAVTGLLATSPTAQASPPTPISAATARTYLGQLTVQAEGSSVRLQPRPVPALDHPVGRLQHPRDRPQARRQERRHELQLRRHQRQLVLRVRRRHLDRRRRRRHRPHRSARRGLALRREQLDHVPPAVLRQRPHPSPADRRHRQRQPVQGRPGPGRVAALPHRVPLHLRPHVGPGEAVLRHDRRLGREERAPGNPERLLTCGRPGSEPIRAAKLSLPSVVPYRTGRRRRTTCRRCAWDHCCGTSTGRAVARRPSGSRPNGRAPRRSAARTVPAAPRRTFLVSGHHYALVPVTGLTPGTSTPYEVLLDGDRVWPLEDSAFPPSTISTPEAGSDTATVSFGSCRWAAPAAGGRDPVGPDALDTLAARLAGDPSAARPDVLLLLGDQVYADETSQADQGVARRATRHRRAARGARSRTTRSTRTSTTSPGSTPRCAGCCPPSPAA